MKNLTNEQILELAEGLGFDTPTQDEKVKTQVEDLARALDDNGGHALSNPGLIERETWVRIARHIPIDVIEETQKGIRQ